MEHAVEGKHEEELQDRLSYWLLYFAGNQGRLGHVGIDGLGHNQVDSRQAVPVDVPNMLKR